VRIDTVSENSETWYTLVHLYLDDDFCMKEKKKKRAKESRPATQTHLPIAEIKDGVVVLRDGTLRKVLMTSSVNYVGFLNSLSFPVQIVVQSRRLQIKPYLGKLVDLEKKQPNELLRVQIADYRAFVEELVDIGQIMTKRFYVVVPYDAIANKKKGFFARLKEIMKPAFTVHLKEERFQKRKEELDTRVRQVASGLSSMSLEAVPLDTQALIELYYMTYNPDIAFAESLGDVDTLQVE